MHVPFSVAAGAGDDAAHYTVPAPALITVVAPATFAFVTVFGGTNGIPPTLAQSQSSGVIQVTPSEAPFFGPITLTISCPLVPQTKVLTWPVGSSGTLSWTYIAPSSGAPTSDACTYLLSGAAEVAHYTAPSFPAISIIAGENLVLSGTQAAVTRSTTTPAMTVTPANGPFLAGCTVTITCTIGGVATPSTLTFAPGVTTPKQFTVTAGATTGTSTCTLVVGGSDALHWSVRPPPFNINVVSTATSASPPCRRLCPSTRRRWPSV